VGADDVGVEAGADLIGVSAGEDATGEDATGEDATAEAVGTRETLDEAMGATDEATLLGETTGTADALVMLGRGAALEGLEMTLLETGAALLVAETVGLVPEPLLRARMRDAAASAATMTMAWVLPVGRSGCIEASTTNRLSVP